MLTLIDATGKLIDKSISVAVAIALLVFFWGLAKTLFRMGSDEKAVEEGKRLMRWGIVALFVMISVWGIVIFMQNALLPGGSTSPPPWEDYL